MLNIYAVTALKDNYIWFIQASNPQTVLIVDPGEAKPVFNALKQGKLVPVAILITHGCHDHVGGINAILEQYDIPVYGPKLDSVPGITHPLSACDKVEINSDFPLVRVLDIPGHTKGHIGFLIDGNLFCGDALFGAGCGRLHSGPAQALFHSLQLIAQLDDETRIYCAHEYTQDNLRFAQVVEPENEAIKQRIIDTDNMREAAKISLPSTLRLELQTNPFLRCDKPAVKVAVEQQCGDKLESAEQVFKMLRLWKDSF